MESELQQIKNENWAKTVMAYWPPVNFPYLY